MSRMTFADGVSAENLRQDLSTQFLGGLVGRIDTAHISLTDKGRSKASVVGEFTGTTFDKVKTPVLTTGILFNPSLLEKLRLFFEKNDCPAHVSEKGEVTTAPASKPTSSDTVVNKAALSAEKAHLQSKFFSLTEAEQQEAKSRIAAIESLLKNA